MPHLIRIAPLFFVVSTVLACSTGETRSGAATTDTAAAASAAPGASAPAAVTPEVIRALAERLGKIQTVPRPVDSPRWSIASAKGTGTDQDAELFAASASDGGDCGTDWAVIRRASDIVLYTSWQGCAVDMYPNDVQLDTIFFDKGKPIGATTYTVTIMGEEQPNTVKSTPITDAARIQKALTLANAIVAVDKAALIKLDTN